MPTANIRAVTSRQNSRVKALRAAFERPGRPSGLSEGLIGIEGEHLLLEALRSNLTFEAVFVVTGSEHWFDLLPVPADVEVLSVPPDIFASAVTTETPQPIAALVHAPIFRLEALAAFANPVVVISAGLQDPGNLGTIIRSAEAFGATGLIALPGTVSQWNPKALRASSGSAFRLPVINCSVSETIDFLRSRKIQILAAAAGENNLHHDLRRPTAILIGNEGAGLSQELLDLADARIAIPCPGITESLNAAVAGSILLYEASRQRGQA